MKRSLALMSLVLAACEFTVAPVASPDLSAAPIALPALDLAAAPPPPPDFQLPPPEPDLTMAGISDKLIAHEWGTYTSVVASTGEVMVGMQHEEEALPSFVRSRGNYTKGMETLASVNQKLETPVIYFYAPRAMAVTVDVKFPKGLISQWYPNAHAFVPPISYDPAVPVQDGGMTWNAQLDPAINAFTKVDPWNIWAPSRRVPAMALRSESDTERFIFYRGVGNFTMPVRFSAGANDAFEVANDSGDRIAALFLLNVHGGGGSVVPLGGLDGHATLHGSVPPAGGKELNPDQFVASAKSLVGQALVGSGLTAEEAKAMVDTWEHSYFRGYGTRILYVAPRAWTDALLPITITPAPDELVRTLVGRVELMTLPEEAALVGQVKAAAAQKLDPYKLVPAMGRLAEPKLRRTLELLSDPAERQYCEGLIFNATRQP